MAFDSALSAITFDFYSVQISLRGENSARVEEHPEPRTQFFHKHHSMLCTSFPHEETSTCQGTVLAQSFGEAGCCITPC